MGSGEIGGNKSVHWTIVHHNRGGAPKSLNHRDRNRVPPTTNADPDTVAVGDYQAEAVDPIEFSDIGTRQGLVAGHFKVTFHYASPSDAAAAAAQAAANVAGGAMVVYVPVVDRTIAANANRPIEIKVEW